MPVLRDAMEPEIAWSGPWMNSRNELRLALSCVVDAPRAEVFRVLTEPAEVAKWFGPHDYRLSSTEIDLTAGGRYRFVVQPPENGVPFHISGRFLSLEPPREMSYTFRYEEPAPDDLETVVTLELESRDPQTMVSLTQGVFATEERLLLHRDGWSDSFERLRGVIEK